MIPETPTPTVTERRDFGTLRLRGRIWWLRYKVDGRTHEESSGSSSVRVAEKLLARRQAELGLGVLVAPSMRRTTFEELAKIITDEYAANGRRSADRLEDCLAHLRLAFGSARASSITTDRLTAYVSDRLAAQAAPSTIRNELNALRRAFHLAEDAGRVTRVPKFPKLAIHNTRTGFFERPDFEAVLAELPAPLRPPLEFAYFTGWRIPSEVLPLTWAQVDFVAEEVRLEVGSTKNRDGRTFPFGLLPALRVLLERQREATRAVERRLGRIVPWVFHRDGDRLGEFHKTWRAACQRAATVTHDNGLTELVRPDLLERIPHDLRRTAVRNLERAGVSRSVATKLTGHKTESVYRRYAIVAASDLAEGVGKLASLHAAQGDNRGTMSGGGR